MQKNASWIALTLYVLLCLTLSVSATAASGEWISTQLKPEGSYKAVMTPLKKHLIGTINIVDGVGSFPLSDVDVCDTSGVTIWPSGSNSYRFSIGCGAPQEINLFYVYQHPADYAQTVELQILLDYEPVAFRVDKAAPQRSYTFTAGPESVRFIPITIPAPQKKAELHDLLFIRKETGDGPQAGDISSGRRYSISTRMETHVLLHAAGCSPNQPPYVIHKLERQLTFIERLRASFLKGRFYVFSAGINKKPSPPWETNPLVATAGKKVTIYVNFITSETGQWAGLLFLDNKVIPHSANQSAVFWQSKAYGLMTAAFIVQLPDQKGIHTLTFKAFCDVYQTEARLFSNERQFQIELR